MAEGRPQGTESDTPALTDVIVRNIQGHARLQKEDLMRRTFQDRTADAIAAFSGRLSFLSLHALWFGLWLLLNTGRSGSTRLIRFPIAC
jgi:uncharacterized membrane protein